MTQQISPFVEAKYGWAFGESGWNSGMDENLLKFSYLFDRNIDGVVSSLPSAISGKAYFLTTDNRIYFATNNSYISTPIPIWFQVTLRSTGTTYQFNGTALQLITSLSDISANITSLNSSVTNLNNNKADNSLLFKNLTPEFFGAVGDSRRIPAFFCTAGNSVITVSAGSVLTSDIGKKAVLPGAGVSGSAHVGTITAVSGTSVTLNPSPSLTVTGSAAQDGLVGTDDTSAWNNMLAAATAGTTLHFSGRYLINSALSTIKPMIWEGGANSALIFPNSNGLTVDRRNEGVDNLSTLATAVYRNFEIITCTSVGFNLTAMNLYGPQSSGFVLRTIVDNVKARGISGSFILNTAWGNGLAGYGISGSTISFSFQGLSVNATKPGSYYGIQIVNSTYVIVNSSMITFASTSVSIRGGETTPFAPLAGTESIIVRDNHLVFGDIGVEMLLPNPSYGGTFFHITGNHVDAHRRAIKILTSGPQGAQSQITDNKLHVNKRDDENLIPRIAIDCSAPSVNIEGNQILFYETTSAEDSYRSGVLLGTNSSGTGVVNNSFVRCTAYSVNVSNVPSGGKVTVALNRTGDITGSLMDANSVARSYGNDWN